MLRPQVTQQLRTSTMQRSWSCLARYEELHQDNVKNMGLKNEQIDPDKTKKNHTDRDLELVLFKKELKEEYWPRLLKEKGKVHFLRTDFDKVRMLFL